MAGTEPTAGIAGSVEDRGGSSEPVFLRDYLIHAPDHRANPIYVAVFSAGQLGQYYDVQGQHVDHAASS